MVLGLVLFGAASLIAAYATSAGLLNMPIAVFAIVAAFGLMPESKGPARPTDLPGMAPGWYRSWGYVLWH